MSPKQHEGFLAHTRSLSGLVNPGCGRSRPKLIGILLAELAAPLADGLISDDCATFEQQLFDIAKAEAEAEVQPHGVADDFHRKAVILKSDSGGW